MNDINMTPLIDVMLVLMVIFIITAPLLTRSIPLNLPQTDAAQASDAPQSLMVVVDATGQVLLKNKPVTLNELAQQFALSYHANPQTELQLHADKAVPYGRIVEIMGAAQKAGLNRIGFIADQTTPPAATEQPATLVTR